jgi:hypothetical protein
MRRIQYHDLTKLGQFHLRSLSTDDIPTFRQSTLKSEQVKEGDVEVVHRTAAGEKWLKLVKLLLHQIQGFFELEGGASY